MSKVAIVGIGAVGSTTAYSLGIRELCDEILIIDHNTDLANAQYKDLSEGFIIANSKTKAQVNKYQNLNEVDIVIITASVPAHKVKNRLDFISVNAKVISSITKSCLNAGFNGIFIIASNPVDIMTSVCQKVSNFPPNKVIGSGTILDTSRLIFELSQALNIDTKLIDGACFGEHGNSIVPIYSQVKINNQSLFEYLRDNKLDLDLEGISQKVINGGYEIFNIKGATTFGISEALVKIVDCILNDKARKLLVTVQTTVNHVEDVYVPSYGIVGKNGAVALPISNLSNEELIALERSALLLKELETEALKMGADDSEKK